MPSLNLYKKMMGAPTVGRVLKNQSDMVMEATWDNDVSTHTCYLYDYWHDDHKTQLKNIHPEDDPNKVAISLKVRNSSQQTYAKDVVTHHIQMKPSQEINVDYYQDFFGDRYSAEFPVGMYLDIPDEKGIYRRWLVVGLANFFVNQFPTYEILPCDYVFNWIYNGQKIKMAGVLRSQSSYNQGTWLDYKVETIEDQQKFILPLNSLSEKIYYNQRFIIDTKVDIFNGAEPRAWRITKVNRINANGTGLFTCAQDQFVQHKDFIEYEDINNPSTLIGMWADYYSSSTEPVDSEQPLQKVSSVKITYSGKAEIKVGGSFKTFNLNFSDGVELSGVWKFEVNGEDISHLVTIKTVDSTQIKVRFDGDEDYMGKTMIVSYVTETGTTTSEEIYIGGL